MSIFDIMVETIDGSNLEFAYSLGRNPVGGAATGGKYSEDVGITISTEQAEVNTWNDSILAYQSQNKNTKVA